MKSLETCFSLCAGTITHRITCLEFGITVYLDRFMHRFMQSNFEEKVFRKNDSNTDIK